MYLFIFLFNLGMHFSEKVPRGDNKNINIKYNKINLNLASILFYILNNVRATTGAATQVRNPQPPRPQAVTPVKNALLPSHTYKNSRVELRRWHHPQIALFKDIRSRGTIT